MRFAPLTLFKGVQRTRIGCCPPASGISRFENRFFLRDEAFKNAWSALLRVLRTFFLIRSSASSSRALGEIDISLSLKGLNSMLAKTRIEEGTTAISNSFFAAVVEKISAGTRSFGLTHEASSAIPRPWLMWSSSSRSHNPCSLPRSMSLIRRMTWAVTLALAADAMACAECGKGF